MSDRKGALIRILSVPIYPHELADPTEAVADYLIDNDVLPVVRCKDCKHFDENNACYCHAADENGTPIFVREHDFCSYGERRSTNEAD